MTFRYLTACCSADRSGRPKIPGPNAVLAPFPPNSPTDPDVLSAVFVAIIVGIVIIYTTITTTSFTHQIYSLIHFLDLYCLIQSAYHPLTSGFRKSGRTSGLSGMPSCWTSYAKDAIDAANCGRSFHIPDLEEKSP